MQHVRGELLFLLVAVNSTWFRILRSYMRPFLCTLELSETFPVVESAWKFPGSLQDLQRQLNNKPYCEPLRNNSLHNLNF